MRIPLLLIACTLAAAPLPAQLEGAAFTPAERIFVPARTTLAPQRLDARLIVRDSDQAARREPRLRADVVTRPRWRYPAIGAAIGITAGVIQAKGMQDPIGFPVDPIYIFPTAYGALGAFVGLLVDSADRERAARR